MIESTALRRWTVAGAIILGGTLGLMRIAQGGHFLSDVIASGFLLTGLSWVLHRVIIARDGLGALAQALYPPSPAVRNLATLGIATAIAGAVGYELLDLPIAIGLHDGLAPLQPAASFVTAFGLGGPYLIVAGLAAVASWIAGRTVAAWRTGYVFLAVAGSGLLADLIKPVAGRARPQLWFADHIYGFTGVGPHASYWSFPSGHAVTAGALAVALSITIPRLTAAWVAGALLIGASRVFLDLHYLSDVIAGFYIGIVSAWAIAALLRANGIILGDR